MTQLAPQAPTTDDVVLLTVPASGVYFGVLRTATAGLAARLQFTLDDIEDLRIAVDEACAMLLAVAALDAELSCRFTIDTRTLTVETSVRTATASPALPARESFAWQVLSALTDEASAQASGRSATILLVKRRPSPPAC
ncbi:MAG: anti-sigma regulatory factor [Dactylosporangium sp.]|nr:anti-sigma regulatory factor [Dactylosporangium sp.]NNJ62734.1 anti-sigma regulatory factor [Dactylosporangium sp.]